eukprot:jgi/Mesvir1/9414/Mv01517-RA.1
MASGKTESKYDRDGRQPNDGEDSQRRTDVSNRETKDYRDGDAESEREKQEYQRRMAEKEGKYKREKDSDLKRQNGGDREGGSDGAVRDAGRDAPSKRGEADFSVRAAITESNGEISCSIEETNRIRISLGLKPLKLDDGKASKAQSDREKEAREQAEKAERDAKAAELARRVESMRETRRQEAKLRSVKTLGEADPEEDMSAAAWIQRSRKLEEERRKAAEMAARLAEQDEIADDRSDSEEEERPGRYSAKDLKGLKIRHGADALRDGQEMILTLKDSAVIADGDINEEEDELENVSVAEQKKREKARREAKKAGKYDDRFDEEGEKKAILSHYDEEPETDAMVIDTNGVQDAAARQQEEIRRKLKLGMAHSLASGPPTVAATSEYYTQEEMAAFKRPKTKKKKKLRAKPVSIVDELEAAAEGDPNTELGSRTAGGSTREARLQEDRQRQAQSRQEGYAQAMSKAADASRALQEEAAREAARKDAAADDDDDDELARSLERSRRLALKTVAGNGDAAAASSDRTGGALAEAKGPEAVARQLAALERVRTANGEVIGGGAEEVEGDEGRIVLTKTEEFCRSLELEAALEESRAAAPMDEPVPGADHSDTAIGTKSRKPAPAVGKGVWLEQPRAGGGATGGDDDDDEAMVDAAEDKEKEDADEEEEDHPLAEEATIGKGLAGALKLLQQKGELKQKIEWAGRNSEKRPGKLDGRGNAPLGMYEGDKEFTIKLERRDEFGRVLTPKEAFRQLSHRFHGKFPGKLKQEKRLKQFAEELRLKKAVPSDTPLGVVEKLKDAQARLKTPYVVLSGVINPGQSSDATNLFGTLQDNDMGVGAGPASKKPTPGGASSSAGSLTPMLKAGGVASDIKGKGAGSSTVKPPLPRGPK